IVGRTSKSVREETSDSETPRNDREAASDEAATEQTDNDERTDLEVRSADINITGLRLETLTHESLPKQGPGLAGNGNFVLGELEVVVGDATRFRPDRSPTSGRDDRERGVAAPGDAPASTDVGDTREGS